MKSIITKIINKWDPVGIKSISPDDEYSYEIDLIEEYLKINGLDEHKLTAKIEEIFANNFGLDIFTKSEQEILLVAHQIVNEVKNIKEKQ